MTKPFRRHTLDIKSKTNTNNGCTYPAIYINSDTFICRLVAVYSFSCSGNFNTAICTCLFLHLVMCV